MKKYLLCCVLATALLSCKDEPEHIASVKPVNGFLIVRNGETVEIYSEGELKAEFTKRNTDSASLKTLYYLDELLKENQSQVPENKKRPVKRSLVMK